jgi:hypothetical protein
MIDEGTLKELLHRKEVTNSDKVLALIAAGGGKGVSAQEVKRRAAAAGLRAARKWDISKTLRRGGGALFTDGGWELAVLGRERLEQLVGPLGGPTRKAAIDLRAVAGAITSP